MLRKRLRLAWGGLAALLSLLLALINGRLYAAPPQPGALADDVLPQLTALRGALEAGAGAEMQRLFPEGYFFTYALYGLAWSDVGAGAEPGSALNAQAQGEILWALGHLDSPAGKAPFAPALDPPLGVFFNGWSSWLRGGLLQIQAPAQRDPAIVRRFQADCAALGAAFDASPTPFLAAYPGQAWPVDSTVALAALRLHDTLFAPRFAATIERWLGAAQARLDPATGLLPHRVDAASGRLLEGARGSSQSIIARFLVEIDAGWGREQYALFRRQFLAAPLGLPGIREYPAGVSGRGDVDSGPLLLGVSASASVVTAGAAQIHQDSGLAGPIFQTSEAVGMPVRWGGSKRYGFGLLPVGEAFLAWAKTARPRIAAPAAADFPAAAAWWWRLPFHGISLAVLALLWLPLARRRRSPSPGR